MHNENWDDLRFVLAVAELGSVLQASKQLGVNHATVLRRITAFEARHGAPVFARTAQGYRLLPDQAPVIHAARQAQRAMTEVDRLASGGQERLQGTVRIASTDTLSTLVLPALVNAMSGDAPGLSVALLSGNAYLDLARAPDHLVVRPAQSLSDDLTGDVVAALGFAPYARPGAPRRWFRLVGPLARSVAAQWMREAVPEADLTAASDSFLTLAELAAAGGGIALLPCFVGDADDRLTRCDGIAPSLSVPLWVARHVDVPETGPMRAVQAKLSRFLDDRRAVLLG